MAEYGNVITVHIFLRELVIYLKLCSESVNCFNTEATPGLAILESATRMKVEAWVKLTVDGGNQSTQSTTKRLAHT